MRQSHLFAIRVWPEELGDGEWEWRGHVQALPSGESYYFREWSDLVRHVIDMLVAGAGDEPIAHHHPQE